jgi:hypothetical protein
MHKQKSEFTRVEGRFGVSEQSIMGCVNMMG